MLVGRNEVTGMLFRHPVAPQGIHAAIRKNPHDPAIGVKAAQRWMWGVTEKQLKLSLQLGMRQGDVLLVRETAPKVEAIANENGVTAVVGGSHEIHSQRIVTLTNGKVLAFAPSLWHSKDQHAPTFANEDGWYSVRVAEEANTWEWGKRLGD